jgi:hypothetical protein
MFSTEAFNRMIDESDLKLKSIYERAGMSKQLFHDIRKPLHRSRLTRERILSIAKVLGSNVGDYFPELENDVVQIMGEPVENLHAYKVMGEVKEYLEDLTIETKKFRDDYISALLDNKRLQDEMIVMLKEKAGQ